MNLEPVFITAIVFYGIYKLVELFVRRGERIKLIDKLTELPPDLLAEKLPVFNALRTDTFIPDGSSSRFIALRWGAFLLGLGLGSICGGITRLNVNVSGDWYVSTTLQTGCLLIGGALGLLVAFVIEYKLREKKRED